MQKQIHFLNGDALLAIFPASIPGDRLISRECLVEGPVHEKELTVFFNARASYLNQQYQTSAVEKYSERVASQFYQLQALATANTILTLWFEDDLFCQVNLWFTLSLLHQINDPKKIYLARPPKHTPYGFGGLTEKELSLCFKRRVLISSLAPWNNLWEAYRDNNLAALLDVAQSLKTQYPFVLPAVSAHIARIPTHNHQGRPKERLKTIVKELGTTQFAPVYRAFCQTEAIYGFGDLTVKRLLDEAIEELNTDE